MGVDWGHELSVVLLLWSCLLIVADMVHTADSLVLWVVLLVWLAPSKRTAERRMRLRRTLVPNVVTSDGCEWLRTSEKDWESRGRLKDDEDDDTGRTMVPLDMQWFVWKKCLPIMRSICDWIQEFSCSPGTIESLIHFFACNVQEILSPCFLLCKFLTMAVWNQWHLCWCPDKVWSYLLCIHVSDFLLCFQFIFYPKNNKPFIKTLACELIVCSGPNSLWATPVRNSRD